jgi:hypothetical protein
MVKPSAYERLVSEGFALGFKKAFEEGFEEGCLLEARKLALRIGQNRFGPPDQTTRAKIESITDLERLKQLVEDLAFTAGWDGWSDLLADL